MLFLFPSASLQGLHAASPGLCLISHSGFSFGVTSFRCLSWEAPLKLSLAASNDVCHTCGASSLKSTPCSVRRTTAVLAAAFPLLGQIPDKQPRGGKAYSVHGSRGLSPWPAGTKTETLQQRKAAYSWSRETERARRESDEGRGQGRDGVHLGSPQPQLPRATSKVQVQLQTHGRPHLWMRVSHSGSVTVANFCRTSGHMRLGETF